MVIHGSYSPITSHLTLALHLMTHDNTLLNLWSSGSSVPPVAVSPWPPPPPRRRTRSWPGWATSAPGSGRWSSSRGCSAHPPSAMSWSWHSWMLRWIFRKNGWIWTIPIAQTLLWRQCWTIPINLCRFPSGAGGRVSCRTCPWLCGGTSAGRARRGARWAVIGQHVTILPSDWSRCWTWTGTRWRPTRCRSWSPGPARGSATAGSGTRTPFRPPSPGELWLVDIMLISDWSTISSDFDLVCGRDYLTSLAQERSDFWQC